jgi:hypothetical protein
VDCVNNAYNELNSDLLKQKMWQCDQLRAYKSNACCRAAVCQKGDPGQYFNRAYQLCDLVFRKIEGPLPRLLTDGRSAIGDSFVTPAVCAASSTSTRDPSDLCQDGCGEIERCRSLTDRSNNQFNYDHKGTRSWLGDNYWEPVDVTNPRQVCYCNGASERPEWQAGEGRNLAKACDVWNVDMTAQFSQYDPYPSPFYNSFSKFAMLMKCCSDTERRHATLMDNGFYNVSVINDDDGNAFCRKNMEKMFSPVPWNQMKPVPDAKVAVCQTGKNSDGKDCWHIYA